MRQIEEFSQGHSRLAWDCVVWTSGLIVWVWISVLLHWREYDMRTVYTLVAIAICLRLFKGLAGLIREERRAARLYSSYLDTFSYPVLHRMKDDESMSSWSRREISRYLHQALRLQY